jgi:hypothetical protein
MQANIFSLGMMLLRLCVPNDPIPLIYCHAINYPLVNEILFSLNRKYSYQLLHLIGGMLNQRSDHRINF